MAAQSTLKNMVLCLTLVCLFCAAVLGGAYALTYEPIQDASRKALEASINVVLPEGGSLSEAQSIELGGQSYEYYESVVDGTTAAYAVKSTAIGFGGPLTVMVGVLPDGSVYNTSVLVCNETPGLGAKCQESESHFRAQFRGLKADGELKVTKDGGSIDAITASTITSRAFTLAINNAVNVVKSLCGDAAAADAVSGASAAQGHKTEEGQSNE